MFKRGDVLCFERDNNILSLFISIGELIGNIGKPLSSLPARPSEIVHTALVLNEEYYVEAIGKGVTINPVTKLEKKHFWLCRLNNEMDQKLTENKKQFNAFINEQIGKPYDFIQFIKFIPYLFTGRVLFRPKEDIERTVCSELIAAAFEAAKMINCNASRITPSDIFAQNWYESRIKITP